MTWTANPLANLANALKDGPYHLYVEGRLAGRFATHRDAELECERLDRIRFKHGGLRGDVWRNSEIKEVRQ
jgi:hypothetical protein